MSWNCPVCETENNDEIIICGTCNFDRSLDYEHYPTLHQSLGKDAKTLSFYKRMYEAENAGGAHKCKQCGKKNFFYYAGTGALVCSNCGTKAFISSASVKTEDIYEGSVPVNRLDRDLLEKYFKMNKKGIISIVGGAGHYVLTTDVGTAEAYGDDDEGKYKVSGWKDIKYAVCGLYNTIGLNNKGRIVLAGKNYDTDPVNTRTWKEVKNISCGDEYIIGLLNDGTVITAGKHPFDPDDLYEWNNIVAISAGKEHAIGLKNDGTVIATGCNNNGQCDVSSWFGIIAVSAGFQHTIALKADGTVLCTGTDPGNDVISSLKNVSAVSAGGKHSVFLTSDGKVIATGDNSNGQCDVKNWYDVVAISAYGDRTLGLRADGKVLMMGKLF